MLRQFSLRRGISSPTFQLSKTGDEQMEPILNFVLKAE
jgi:hypothetical protein